MVMRRRQEIEKDAAGNRTRVRNLYFDSSAGMRAPGEAPVGIGGGPGSRAAARGLVAPGARDGADDQADQAPADQAPEVRREGGHYLVDAPNVERRVAELLEQERAGDRERLVRSQQRERELMERIEKLEKDVGTLMEEVAEVQQRNRKAEGGLLKLEDTVRQITAKLDGRVTEIEKDLGRLGDVAAKMANSS